MRKSLGLGALAALLTAAPLSAQAGIILDSFQERVSQEWPKSTSVTDPTIPIGAEPNLPSILGGQRDSGLGASTTDFVNFDNATADIYNLNGYSFLDYRSSVGAAATLELGYGSANSLNISGISGLQIDFLNYDAASTGPLHVNVTLFHGATSQLFGADVTQQGAQSLVVPLSFNQSVDRIVVDFVSPKGTDFRIDALSATVVPEPASLGLLLTGGAALLIRRRRQPA